MLKRPVIFRMWQQEFRGYDAVHFRRDLLAGLTVAAVALPLALAFGVASQATAAAGLVTAIIAGFVIGALSGAPYQISGPTGAMSAVLVVIVAKHGLPGLWLAATLAGVMMLALGIFRLGAVINFIPAPVITGFTSGIALIIFIGQIDNFLGVKTPAADTAAQKAVGYFTQSIPLLNFQAILSALIVVATMVLLPRFKRTAILPAALIGIALATTAAWLLNWQVNIIGEVPGTIILEDRFQPTLDLLGTVGELVVPAAAIAALGAIESLLAGTVAGRMTDIKLNANQELIAQGVGNIVIPFFGGVPATAAIARITVGVKAGGATRLVSIIHSVALLLSALFLGAIIGRIPLAALAGVLMVTAFRMNEWHLIKFYVKRRLKSPTTVMVVTMLATVALDLTQAIIVGVILSLLLFISQVSRLSVVPTDVDWERLRQAGHPFTQQVGGIKVIYVTGPLFFGAANQLVSALDDMPPGRVIILSMRGVPLMDASGLHAIEQLWQNQIKRGGYLYLTGLQPAVQKLIQRAGLSEEIGKDKLLWSADQAINSAYALLTTIPPAEPSTADNLITEDIELDEMPLGVVKM
ncbi:MAG: SulP family inorganic anion transporter [Chloroflexota bacterium]